ncbi:hypothetical protein H0H93_005888 [Arthromyces matolae]|nr:hypothetical protein H0H93_005888 [Arthromyces matolae]
MHRVSLFISHLTSLVACPPTHNTFSIMPKPDEVKRSYANLNHARQEATKTGYNSAATRAKMQALFWERFAGKEPYQLDVTEALLLSLDCTVIAGTGAGKTMPFMMPCLLHPGKKVVVISPLKILQADQANRFRKMGISAAAVNGDTWCRALEMELINDQYQGILVLPEMCFEHQRFREIVYFRKNYSALNKLRAFFPSKVPILATSATLPPAALSEVRASLLIDASTSFSLNLGNDRPNIAYSAQSIKSSTHFNSLRPLLLRVAEPQSPEDLIKTIVFTNTVNLTLNRDTDTTSGGHSRWSDCNSSKISFV